MSKKRLLAQKWVFRATIAEAVKIDSSWPNNHFLPIITPPNLLTFTRITFQENFFPKKIWTHGTPMGYLSRDPLRRIFCNMFFWTSWTSWTPWAFPYLRMQWRPPKISKGCVHPFSISQLTSWLLNKDIREKPVSLLLYQVCLCNVVGERHMTYRVRLPRQFADGLKHCCFSS